MRIVSRTGSVVVCTLSLHSEGPWFKSWQVLHIDWEKGRDSPFFLFSLMTKPLNTENELIILTLIGAVAGFCLVSLDVKEKYTNQSHESIKHAKKSIFLLLA